MLFSVANCCVIADCEIKEVEINSGYKVLAEYDRDGSISPNYLPIDKQDFLKNKKPECCITQSCSISGNTNGMFRIASDGVTLEYDFSAGQETISDAISVTCSYLPSPDTFSMTSIAF